ncbi:bone morphogenetic protein [Elysia marginata]|uniref:Bone morphogenetic protein n=1 Tax=Elysia marginata TaxID=1093978 RepID=A0AAV4G987_9GAST|nr:bone morphogenetic protein [Elysia marginata]
MDGLYDARTWYPTPTHVDMFKDRGKILARSLSQLLIAVTRTGRLPSTHASSSSSNRKCRVWWRSWLLVSLAVATMASTGLLTQAEAKPRGANRPNSFTRPSRFHRAGLSGYTRSSQRPSGKLSSEKYSPLSSSSLPSPVSRSSVDLRELSPSRPTSSAGSAKSRTEPDALARLSKVFGMSRIPHHAIRRSPPQYMQEIYASTTDTGGLTRARGPYNSNTIRSFPDKGQSLLKHFTRTCNS